MKFWHELLFWIMVATAITLFTAGFLPAFKIFVGHLPSSGPTKGLRDALASSGG